MHVSAFDEPCNTPPHWHCRFHTFNRPQLGFRLKYFIRLARIGIAYCSEAGGKKAELGKKMRNTKKQSGSQAERSQLFISTHNEALSVAMRASTIQIVRHSQSRAETQPKLQPAFFRLSAMISRYFPVITSWLCPDRIRTTAMGHRRVRRARVRARSQNRSITTPSAGRGKWLSRSS